MTAKKQIAATIKRLIHGDTFGRVLDRSVDVQDVIDTLVEHWEFNIEDRRPGPALVDPESGTLQPTDLDLACLAQTLARRKAVVVMEKGYESTDVRKDSAKSTGQKAIGAPLGMLTALVSNEDLLTFSGRMNNLAILNTKDGGSLGAPRTYRFVGKDTRWHPGYHGMTFVADAKENEFLKKFDLARDGEVAFKNFVHPQRWTSFYGQYYFLTKVVIARLEEEARSLYAFIKTNKDAKAKKASSYDATQKPESDDAGFKTTKMEVPVFNAEPDAPFRGEFSMPTSVEEAEKHRNAILYGMLPALRFPVRATELAFYKRLGERAGFPSWIRNAGWEDFRIKNTVWRRLVYGQLMPGQQGIALRYRIRSKLEDVAVIGK